MAIPKNLLKASEKMGERRDCSVKAVAITCGVKYEIAHKALSDAGRNFRQGSNFSSIEQAVNSLGRSMIPENNKFKAKTVVTLARELPKRGVFLVMVQGHIIACRSGKVLDWTDGRRHRIQEIWRVK